jgi:hypothetical protein
MMNNKELEEQIATNNKKEKEKREEQKQLLRMTNPYNIPSFNPSHPITNIPTSQSSNPNPTRNEIIKLDLTGKYVCLKRPGTNTKNLTKTKIQTPTIYFGSRSWKQRSPEHYSKQREETQQQPNLTKKSNIFQTNTNNKTTHN